MDGVDFGSKREFPVFEFEQAAVYSWVEVFGVEYYS